MPNVGASEELYCPFFRQPLPISAAGENQLTNDELSGKTNDSAMSESLAGTDVQITTDPNAVVPTHSETHQEPVHPEDMPKADMHIPHPGVDALFDVTIVG